MVNRLGSATSNNYGIAAATLLTQKRHMQGDTATKIIVDRARDQFQKTGKIEIWVIRMVEKIGMDGKTTLQAEAVSGRLLGTKAKIIRASDGQYQTVNMTDEEQRHSTPLLSMLVDKNDNLIAYVDVKSGKEIFKTDEELINAIEAKK